MLLGLVLAQAFATPAQLVDHPVREPVDPADAFVVAREILPVDLAAELAPRVADRWKHTWTVVFDRRLHDLRVVDAKVDVRVRDGRVVMLRVDPLPDVDVDPIPVLDADEAAAVARELDPGPWLADVVRAPELVIVPVDGGARLAWAVEIRSAAPEWGIAYVDAHTGEAFAFEQLLRHGFTAHVHAKVDDRSPDQGLVEVPVPWLQVGSALTAVDGSLDVDETLAANVSLQGRWAIVSDYGGAPLSASLSADPASPVAVLSAASADQAELSAFVSTNQVHARAVAIAPDNSWAGGQTRVNVNLSDTCNAYFDGSSINFFREGGGCANTARLADVVFHEYGHGFHYYAIVSGQYDRAMGEGAADYLAATITDDPEIAPGFFGAGQGIRDLEPDRVYPRDVTGWEHEDGLIYGGAMWDLRTALIAKHGHGRGVMRADELFYATLRGSRSMLDAYLEAVLAADDDADLTNGVPDGCEIVRAFDAHGLVQDERVHGALAIGHTPPEQGLVLRAVAERGDCGGEPVQEVVAHVLAADGTVEELAMTASDGAWTVDLGERKGLVRYWISATDGETTVTLPRNAPEDAFSLWAGGFERIWCQTFEDGFGAWTHGAIGLDPSIRGVDEWETGAPQGLAGDPSLARRGSAVAGIDLGRAGDGDGRYEADVETWLQSEVVETAGRDGLRLQFWRRLAVEDGGYDQARVLVNGEEIWANPAGRSHEDPGWVLTDVPLGAVDEVQVRFELTSDGGLELGGWAVDDVCLIVPGPPQGEDGRPPLEDGEAGMRVVGCSITPGGAPWLAVLVALAAARRRARGRSAIASERRGGRAPAPRADS